MKALLAAPGFQLGLCYTGVVGSLLVYGVLQVSGAVRRALRTKRYPPWLLGVRGAPRGANLARRRPGAGRSPILTLPRPRSLQERIMTLPYGTDEAAERFKYSLFLVLCNRIMSCAVALVMLLVRPRPSPCAAHGRPARPCIAPRMPPLARPPRQSACSRRRPPCRAPPPGALPGAQRSARARPPSRRLITPSQFNGKVAELKPVAPVYSYAAVSFSNVVATTCQYEALKYLWFPLQSLGKCAKMFPVMVWGILMLRKKYQLKDYAIATAITMGCTMFVLTGDVKSRASNTDNFFLYGGGLMLGYLAFDGFTSTFQDKMFKGYQMTTYNQVLYTTMWSSILSSLTLFSSGQLAPAIAFVARHPEALVNIAALSAAATAGSLFISYTIKSFGALTFAQIMTLRQFLSIVLSSMVFMHPLTTGQWASAVLIVATMYYQSLSKSSKPKEAKAASLTGAKEPADEESLKPLIAGDDRAKL
jgi:adenosine 3'-phospho 5'-phosphosulfate transporter B2